MVPPRRRLLLKDHFFQMKIWTNLEKIINSQLQGRPILKLCTFVWKFKRHVFMFNIGKLDWKAHIWWKFQFQLNLTQNVRYTIQLNLKIANPAHGKIECHIPSRRNTPPKKVYLDWASFGHCESDQTVRLTPAQSM